LEKKGCLYLKLANWTFPPCSARVFSVKSALLLIILTRTELWQRHSVENLFLYHQKCAEF